MSRLQDTLTRLTTRLAHQSARRLGKAPLPLLQHDPILSITFDDFPTSAWETGGRILAHHGVRGSYFVAGNLCGTRFDGTDIIDAARLPEVINAGHEIGGHTFTHRRLRGLSARDIRAEFDANRTFLAKVVPGETVTSFAYPYGDLSLSAKRTALSQFDACRGVFAGVNTGTTDRGLLSCVCLEPHVLSECSVDQWIAETVRTRGWLILLTHDVSDTPGPFGTTPKLLDHVLTTATAAGCKVLPVREVMAQIRGAALGRA